MPMTSYLPVGLILITHVVLLGLEIRNIYYQVLICIGKNLFLNLFSYGVSVAGDLEELDIIRASQSSVMHIFITWRLLL